MMSKTMPWFRFYSEALHDRKIAKAAQAVGVQRLVIIGAWVSILSLASESPERGKLLVTLQERFNETDIADELGIDETTAKSILAEFVKFEMLHLENGVYCVTNWQNRQFDSDFSTERVRKHRSKQQCNVSGTPPDTDTDTESDTESDTETYIDEEKKTTPKKAIDDIPDGDLAPYEVVFTQETKLPVFSGGPERWFEGLQKIKESGASPDDFREAIRELAAAVKNGKRYNLISPASYVNATLNIVAKRSAQPASQRDPAYEAEAARLRRINASINREI